MIQKGFASKLKNLFKKQSQSEDFFEDLEELLIESDIGAAYTMELVDELQKKSETENLKTLEEYQKVLKGILFDELKSKTILPKAEPLTVFLVLGVNGVGKTTTIAKMANFFQKTVPTEKIVFAAADTFRAAAIEQLTIHSQRLGFRIVKQSHGSDPGAVIFDSIESAYSRNEHIVLADTAGRMHNKKNLVKELEKIDSIVKRKIGEGRYEKLLVIDATTGQNGFQQAEIFHEAIGVDSVALTKFDSTAKGGIAVSISRKLGLPFSFLCSGEKLEDIQVFHKGNYLDRLLGIE
ncbi:MAG: signal recognition particle-docking protein FtsY [Spirochaetia bacterium]